MKSDPSGSEDELEQQGELESGEPLIEVADDESDLPDKLFFRIGEAAQIVGVEPHVLRYWEAEFQMRPERSTSGQRMYRRNDIARFLRIRRLLHDEGFTIAGARKTLLDPDAEVAPSSVDASRVHQAIERISAARQRIAEVRARLEHVGLNTR